MTKERVICPSCEGDPVDSDGNICGTCDGACMVDKEQPTSKELMGTCSACNEQFPYGAFSMHVCEKALLPCPFCGRPARFEQCEGKAAREVRWSVGCEMDMDAETRGDMQCIGWMSQQTYARKGDAAKAWNTRYSAVEPGPGTLEARFAALVVMCEHHFGIEPQPLSSEGPETRIHRAMQAASAQPPAVAPSAWYRGVRSAGSPSEPDEYDVEMSYGDDQPEGKGWIPLYRTPGIVRLHDDVLRRLDEWFAAYMHDRQNHDEAAALLSQVRDLRSTSTKRSDAP